MKAATIKQQGVVLTPQWVVDFMLKELWRGRRLTGREKILDAGCGEGIFAKTMVQEFARRTGRTTKQIIRENLYFMDIAGNRIARTKKALQRLVKGKITHYNAVTGDFCFKEPGGKFDFIIGNPPYVRIQNLHPRQRARLQKKFRTTARGAIDLYFCFFERALDLLGPKGRLAFITPNSYFYSRAGAALRQLLAPHLTKIVNFDDTRVFKNALTYPAITFLTKSKNRFLRYAEATRENLGKIRYRIIPTKRLQSGSWAFYDQAWARKRDRLARKHPTLTEIADIHCGLATLKDAVYIFRPERRDRRFFYFQGHRIERPSCVPIIKASTYQGQDQDLYSIFPYLRGEIIPLAVFRKKYPGTFRYLLSQRATLEARDRKRARYYPEFYAFGRAQGLKTTFGKKIITSTLNPAPNFYVIEDEKTTFYAGYCVKPKNPALDLYRLRDALNSKLMKEHVSAVSKSYRGGYKSYAKIFLRDFVHPAFKRDIP